MAITNFPAERWSAIVEVVRQARDISGLITSSIYQPESVGARRVVINKVATPVIKPYVSDNDTDDLVDSQLFLDLDQLRYYQFKVENHQLAQSAANYLEPAAQQAATALANTKTSYVLGSATYGDAGITNKLGAIGSSVEITSANVYETILNANEMLDGEHVPEDQRWAVVPPWFYNKIKLARKDYFLSGNEQVFGSGVVTNIDGLNLVKSTLVGVHQDEPADPKEYQIMFFSSRAIASAMTLEEFGTLEVKEFFGTIVRQLAVWGSKVVHPNEIVVLSALNGSED